MPIKLVDRSTGQCFFKNRRGAVPTFGLLIRAVRSYVVILMAVVFVLAACRGRLSPAQIVGEEYPAAFASVSSSSIEVGSLGFSTYLRE